MSFKTFNAKDIDPKVLYNKSYEEGIKIYNKPSTCRGRTLYQCIESCMVGHCAELHMINTGYFIDDERNYKDVIRLSDNLDIEVKVSRNINYGGISGCEFQIQHHVEKMIKYPMLNWSKTIYMWLFDESTLDYEFEGVYEYDQAKKSFSLQSRNLIV